MLRNLKLNVRPTLKEAVIAWPLVVTADRGTTLDEVNIPSEQWTEQRVGHTVCIPISIFT